MSASVNVPGYAGNEAAGVRTAVVLARGLGTRMRAASDSTGLSDAQARAAASGYKALMPLGEHVLVDYSLSALADAGIERAVLVVAPEHEAFAEHFAAVAPTRLRIDFAIQAEPHGTADALRSAGAVVGNEACLMVNGDNYYPTEALRALVEAGGRGEHALIGFERAALVAQSNIPAERVAAFALLEASHGLLTGIVEKPPAEMVEQAGPQAMVSMNAFVFQPDIFEVCGQILPSSRGEYEIVDAVRRLETVHVLPYAGGVLDLSRQEDIADVQARLSGVQVAL